MSDDKDQRPEVAQDGNPKSPKDSKEKWHNPEATMDEAPAGSPDAEKRSRISDG